MGTVTIDLLKKGVHNHTVYHPNRAGAIEFATEWVTDDEPGARSAVLYTEGVSVVVTIETAKEPKI